MVQVIFLPSPCKAHVMGESGLRKVPAIRYASPIVMEL